MRKHSRTLRFGALNVRGCGGSEVKEDIGRLCEKRNFDVFALNETKLKGKGEVEFGSWKGRKSGVNGGRAREGVVIIVKEELLRFVKEWREISSRIMWVRMCFQGEKWVFVSAYGPGSERPIEEILDFWEELKLCIQGFEENEIVIILGDLNARVGSVPIEGVVGNFGVGDVNESGEKLIEMCEECRMCIGNTYFKKKLIHKYTWHRVAHGEIIDRALMDYVLVKRDKLCRLLDVNVMRGEAEGMSDHFLVEGKVKVRPCVRRKWNQREVREVIKASKLADRVKEREYQAKVNEKWMEVRGTEEGQIEDEWQQFKEVVTTSAEEVCGKRRVGGGGIRKGSEWWNDTVKKAVEEKRQSFERFLQDGGDENYQLYRVKRREAKQKVQEAKISSNERWGMRISENFKECKKMFWKEVNRVRKGDQKKEEAVKDENGELLMEDDQVRRRYAGYFESLLNIGDGREAVEVAAYGGAIPMAEGMNERIVESEVKVAVSKMKAGKAEGIDGVAVECIKRGGDGVIKWLVRVFNICFSQGMVPLDWRSACIVPLYKGKGDRKECSSYRGISLLSVVGKLYGRVVIERVMNCTEGAIGDEQCGFRKGRGCADQIFAVRQICEKYLEKKKDVYWAFMDLEKAYDRVDREALWNVLRIYGVGGKLLEAIKSFYVESRACVRVGNGMSDWFNVHVGLRQGCVMSPWLFNVFMDGVVREVTMRTMGRGLSLIGKTGERWELNQLLFADDTALVADSEVKLQRVVKEFGVVCDRRKLKVNVNKSKVMVCSRNAHREMNIRLDGEKLEQVECFKYLGGVISRNPGVETEVRQKVCEGRKVFGAMKSMWKVRSLETKAKRAMYEGIVVPTVMYGSETWSMNAQENRRLDVMEMACLRSICGVTRRDRVRNEEIRRRVDLQVPLSKRVERRVLSWYGHVERMGEERLTKKIYESEGEGIRPRGRPIRRWKDSVRGALHDRGVTEEQAGDVVLDRSEWRRLVYR